MIDSQLHPADEIVLFGHTIHGLLRILGSSKLIEVDGVLRPLPARYGTGYAARATTQVVKKPGIGEVALSTEALAAERAEGRVWQNYALLRGNLSLFGHDLGGWIYFDGQGDRWLIRPNSLPNAVVGAAYSVTFTIRPFGYLDETPATPREVTVTLPNNGQTSAVDPRRFVSLTSVRSDGSQALLLLARVQDAALSGYISVQVSGDGDTVALSMTVLRSEDQVLGTWSSNAPANFNSIPRHHYRVVATPAPAGLTSSYEFPPEGATVSWEATSVTKVAGEDGSASFYVLEASYIAGRTGRLLAMVFDDQDQLVEFTQDTTYEVDINYPEPTAAVSGTASITANYGNLGNKATVGSVSLELSRQVSSRVSVVVGLRRNGLLITSSRAEVLYSASQSGSETFSNPDFQYLTGTGEWWMVQRMTAWESEAGGRVLTVTDGFPLTVSAPPDTALAAPWVFCGVGEMFPLSGDERDAYALGAFAKTRNTASQDVRIEWKLARHEDGARFMRRHLVANTIAEHEAAVAYAHAELLWRGESPPGTAYHPVTHEVATDNANGPASGFV